LTRVRFHSIFNADYLTKLIDFIADNGGAVINADGEKVTAIESNNLYIVCADSIPTHIDSILTAESIELAPCLPQPQTVPDRGKYTDA